MIYSERVCEAFTYAFHLHRNQTRKGAGQPYIGHLMSVAGIVVDFGGDEDQVVAALLHDAPEDQGGQVILDEIRKRFGDGVAGYVEALSDSLIDSRTEDKEPWEVRKARYLERLTHKPPAAKLISAADKLHNARSTLRDVRREGRAAWDKFNATREQSIWYYESLVERLSHNWDHPILDELAHVVERLKEADALAEDA